MDTAIERYHILRLRNTTAHSKRLMAWSDSGMSWV